MRTNKQHHVGGASGRPALGSSKALPGIRAAFHDPRWPAIAAALAALRERKRFAVRIVDVDCGAGSLLIHAAHHARALGFTAIEGRGIDGSPLLVGRARVAALRVCDRGIGLSFELADVLAVLAEESEMPADIVLWHGTPRGAIDVALAQAADLVIRDDVGQPGASRA